MATRQITICNFCKAEIDTASKESLFWLNVKIEGSYRNYSYGSPYNRFDVCPDCLKKVGIERTEKPERCEELSTGEQLYNLIAQITAETKEDN